MESTGSVGIVQILVGWGLRAYLNAPKAMQNQRSVHHFRRDPYTFACQRQIQNLKGIEGYQSGANGLQPRVSAFDSEEQ